MRYAKYMSLVFLIYSITIYTKITPINSWWYKGNHASWFFIASFIVFLFVNYVEDVIEFEKKLKDMEVK